jgi:O-antigen ligase
MLAFAGFAIALHEWTSRSRSHAISLAVVNLALVILSGTRMAIFASALFMVAYGALSGTLRRHLRRERWAALTGLGLVGATLIVYWPTLLGRLFEDGGAMVNLNGRAELWSLHGQQFLSSPWFGRGLGAGFVAAAAWYQFPLSTPHNEYLHLLVIGGVIGFALIGGGIVLWCRQLLQGALPHDRAFLLATALAMAIYAMTDNVLVYPSGLALYAYFGAVHRVPSRAVQTAPDPWRADRAHAHSS